MPYDWLRTDSTVTVVLCAMTELLPKSSRRAPYCTVSLDANDCARTVNRVVVTKKLLFFRAD